MKKYELNAEALRPTELRNLYIASLQNKLSKGECISCGKTCACIEAKDQGVTLGRG